MEALPSTHYKGMQITMVSVCSIMTFLGFVAVLLRVIARCMIVRKLGYDDWFMVAGLIFTGGYLFEILYGVKYGIALHGNNGDIPIANMPRLLQIIYAVQLTYNTVIALVKISIVCFYLRLAPGDGGLRLASWVTIVFLVVFYVTTQVASVLQCRPVEANWDITGLVPRNCFNTLVYFYIIAAINIVVDIWILIMPIKTLKNIKRPKRDKIVLFIVFGIGAFSCISSIVRLYTIKIFASSDDPFYDGAPINIWSFIEVNVAIICASVPAMKPLFTKNIRERVTNASKSSRSYEYRNNQMIPLSGSENGLQTPNSYRDRMNKNFHSAKVTSKYGVGDSDEHIVGKHGGIEYEREFTVEEQYIGDFEGLPKTPRKAYQ